MRIFVTGHRGYIGAHLTKLLKEEDYEVVGCDLDLYASSRRGNLTKADLEIRKDIREIKVQDLEGCDCVMHLAAISNDRMGELDEQLTEEINVRGSVHLAKQAKQAGVPRFLFASSCSIYGRNEDITVDENALLQPQTVYARSKIKAENAISDLASDSFSPTFLRNATAFGDSVMLRLDLVVNNLLACACARGELRIQNDDTLRSPLIHVQDIARAFIAFAKAPRIVIHNLAVNIGSDKTNVQVRKITKLIQEGLPMTKMIFTGEVGSNPRNSRISFQRLSRVLPEFQISRDLRRGIREMLLSFSHPALSREELESGKYERLPVLKELLKDKRALVKVLPK